MVDTVRSLPLPGPPAVGRRWWVVAGVSSVALLIAWMWAVPALVSARVQSAAEARFGMRVTIGGAGLRPTGVVLSDVELHGREGGVRVVLEEMTARAGLVALLLRGASAVREVVVTGSSIDVNLEHAGAAASIAAIGRARRSTSEAGADDGGDRPPLARQVRLDGLSVTVTDSRGRLVWVREGRVSSDGLAMRLEAETVTLGASPGDMAVLGGVDVRLARADGRYQLDSVEVARLDGLWARRAAVTETPDAIEAATPSQSAVIQRLLEAVGVLTAAPGEGDAPAAPAEGGALLARLSPQATFRLDEGVVRVATEHGERRVLERLSVSLERRGEDWLHAEGSGSPGSGGALRWDFDILPGELRGEGSIEVESLPLALLVPALPDIPWHAPESATVDGHLTIEGSDVDRLSVRGSLSVRNAALYSPRIAPVPVQGINLTVRGTGTWLPAERRLDIAEGEVTLGDALATVRGSAHWHNGSYKLDLLAFLPRTRCRTAISAIPRDLLGEVADFNWRGTMGGRLRARLDSDALDETVLDIDIHESCEFLRVPAIADLRRVEGPFLHRVLEPDGRWFEMHTGPGTPSWTNIEEVSPYMIHAVLAQEDARFFRHHGFAPWAIRDALVRNLSEGRFVYGASTISMQLAKNLFLHREKTLARKVQEILLTWWLEVALDKADILELYFNVIEYGPGIYGIRHATREYFGREPSELSPAEAAFLSLLLPAPKSYYRRYYRRGELGTRMQNRVRRRLQLLFNRGRIDPAALQYGLAELDTFGFHSRGARLPAPRRVTGRTSPLPFGRGADAWGTWEGWGEEPAEPAPDPEDTGVDPHDAAAEEPPPLPTPDVLPPLPTPLPPQAAPAEPAAGTSAAD